MSEQTGISWTDHTFNPWWGCVKVSPACTNCYAERDSKRYGFKIWGQDSERRFFGDKHWAEPLLWDRKAEKAAVRRRVFCASMADVFEDRPDLVPHRERLFRLIDATPNLDWLLLTKRPENIVRLWPGLVAQPGALGCWSNLWLGVTAENQEYADKRIHPLLSVPAVVHFLSYEPALGPLDLAGYGWLSCVHESGTQQDDHFSCSPIIDLVIAGGESGGNARPSHPDWFRSVRDQCVAAGVSFHFKQWGEYADPYQISHAGYDDVVMNERAAYVGDAPMWRVGKKSAGRLLDGRVWDEMPGVNRLTGAAQ